MPTPFPVRRPERAFTLPERGGTPGLPRVLVVSDQALVADAVRTALVSHGLDAVGGAVPRGPQQQVQTLRMRQLEPGVVLMLADLTRESRLEAARSLVEDLRLPTVVLTATYDEALWGAMLESGAATVLPVSSTLDEVVHTLRDLARGVVLLPLQRRREMIAAWDRLTQARFELAVRIGSLSPRELEVLRLLYRGESVQEIADGFGVAVATVRSQVRSILRKLGVSSQLAAVAAYARLGTLGDNGA